MFPVTVHVPVSDVAAAERFYRQVFPVEPVAPGELRLGRFVILRVVDETAYVADPEDRYQKGRSPVVEIRVQAIEPWIDRAVKEGAVPRTAIRDDDVSPLVYATIIDPFGHAWSFLRDEQKGHVFGSSG